MTTLADLGSLVQNRLEEPIGPGIFWNLVGEIYPGLVEAMNEATLITGEPEVRQSTQITLTKNTTFFILPQNAVALLRVQSPEWIEKTSLWDLDRMTPGWESETGDFPKAWFPIGLTQFGLYPKLNADVQAFISYIALPVPAQIPYTGTEGVDFQNEFEEGFVDYASHVLQLKEGGEEFLQSAKLYDRFLAKMTELSKFAYRKGSLRFTRTMGAPARVSPVEKK